MFALRQTPSINLWITLLQLHLRLFNVHSVAVIKLIWGCKMAQNIEATETEPDNDLNQI